jgi:hypothetical protein
MEEWEEENQPQVILCKTSQLCASAVALAAAIDVCRDKKAREQLLQALRAVIWQLDPPRGEVHDIVKKSN